MKEDLLKILALLEIFMLAVDRERCSPTRKTVEIKEGNPK